MIMTEPIRVLQVVASLNAGGMENYIMNLYRMVDKSKVQFDFVVHHASVGLYEDEIQELGGEIYHFTVLDDKNVVKYISAVCLEGSLKLKEISYIHSEAYAAGELKHGTISLIEQGTLVIGVLTQNELYEKTVSNMLECKSRGAYLMGLTTYGKYEIEDQVNFTVYVPKVDELFIGSLAVIPLQLLGYYVSVAKGLDVDRPRNLAKSVTVE